MKKKDDLLFALVDNATSTSLDSINRRILEKLGQSFLGSKNYFLIYFHLKH